MKSKDQLLLEEAYQQVVSSVLYHGTPEKAKADSIIKNGLRYDQAIIDSKYKDNPTFAPLKGGVYLTKDFGNAVRYGFMHADYEQAKVQHPEGFVFEFLASDLKKITPDEDEVGMFVSKLIKKGADKQPQVLQNILNQIPSKLSQRLKDEHVPFETYAMVGKFVLENNLFSKSVIEYLSKNNINVVSYETMFPKAVWIIPKPDSQFLKDRQGTFNTHNGYTNYGKRFGTRKVL